jgi:hypothetical protein
MIQFLIGLFIGALAGGWYAAWFNRALIRQGMLKYELTEKFLNKLKNKKS